MMKTEPKFNSKQRLALGVFALVAVILVVGVVFVWKGEDRAFFISYRILKRVHPQKAASLAYEKSEAFRRTENIEKMLALYDEMIEANLADATVLNNRAYWLFGKDNETAEKYLARALAIAPVCAECMNNMGAALLRKQPQKAKEFFEQAAKANPSYIEPHLNLATYMENHGEWKKALDLYRGALAQVKDDQMKESLESRVAWMADVADAPKRDAGGERSPKRDISGKKK